MSRDMVTFKYAIVILTLYHAQVEIKLCSFLFCSVLYYVNNCANIKSLLYHLNKVTEGLKFVQVTEKSLEKSRTHVFLVSKYRIESLSILNKFQENFE